MLKNNYKTALVTGASSGIGEETVKLLVKNNIKVYAVARRKNKLIKLEKTTGCIPIVMDIRDRVVNGDRPRAPTFGCSPRIIKLIKECWAQDSTDRPDFTTIVDELIEVGDSIQEYKATEGLGDGGGDALDGLLGK